MHESNEMNEIYELNDPRPNVLQLIGYKNTGKTTLLCALVERFKADGLTVGTVKRDGHDFELDRPGTDTYRHRSAGADRTAITSASQTAWLIGASTPLPELIAGMQGLNVVLVEGFKTAQGFPKLVLLREKAHLALLREVSDVAAAVVWPDVRAADVQAIAGDLPVLSLDEPDTVYRLAASLLRK